jgi:hypothetical protein
MNQAFLFLIGRTEIHFRDRIASRISRHPIMIENGAKLRTPREFALCWLPPKIFRTPPSITIDPTIARPYRPTGFILPGFNFRPLKVVLKYINSASR